MAEFTPRADLLSPPQIPTVSLESTAEDGTTETLTVTGVLGAEGVGPAEIKWRQRTAGSPWGAFSAWLTSPKTGVVITRHALRVIEVEAVARDTSICDLQCNPLESASFFLNVQPKLPALTEGGVLDVNTVDTSQLVTDAVDGPKIASSAITAVKIAALTITAGEIAANAITSSKIRAGAIVAGKIAAGAIVAADIAAGTITGNEITGSTLSAIFADVGTLTAGTISTNVLIASQNFTATTVFVKTKLRVGAQSTGDLLPDVITINNTQIDFPGSAGIDLRIEKVSSNILRLDRPNVLPSPRISITMANPVVIDFTDGGGTLRGVTFKGSEFKFEGSTTSLFPDTTNVVELGKSGKVWEKVWATDIDAAGSVVVGDATPGDNFMLLQFNTSRAWRFETDGVDGANQQLMLRTENAGKEFRIGSDDGTSNVEFTPHNTVASGLAEFLCPVRCVDAEIDGDLNHDGTNIGFYAATPIAKQTVTGSRAGNSALTSLLSRLNSLGLITDSTV